MTGDLIFDPTWEAVDRLERIRFFCAGFMLRWGFLQSEALEITQ